MAWASPVLGKAHPSRGQKYRTEVAYGLGATPSTAVQLYMPRLLFLTANGGMVQLMAGKGEWRV